MHNYQKYPKIHTNVHQKIALINVRFGQGYLSSYERVPAYPLGHPCKKRKNC